MLSRRDIFAAVGGLALKPATAPIGDLKEQLAALAPAGGTLYLPAGVTPFDGPTPVPPGVNILGQGSGWDAKGSVLKALSPSARLMFGARQEGSPGGISGNFTIDGAQADQPLYVGRTLQRTFLSLDVVGSRGDQLLIEEAQNNLFISVNLNRAGGSAMVIDRGAGGNQFVKCNVNAATRFGLWIVNRSAGGKLVYAVPTHNEFDHCIFERSKSGTSARIEDAKDTTFDNCVFASASDYPVAVVEIERGLRIRLRGSLVTGSRKVSTGLSVARGSTVYLSEQTTFNNLLRVSNHTSGAALDLGEFQASAIGPS